MDTRRGKSLNTPISGICQGTLLHFVGLATVSASFFRQGQLERIVFLASLLWLTHFFIIIHLGLLGIA